MRSGFWKSRTFERWLALDSGLDAGSGSALAMTRAKGRKNPQKGSFSSVFGAFSARFCDRSWSASRIRGLHRLKRGECLNG
jgi:hypothetical protein